MRSTGEDSQSLQTDPSLVPGTALAGGGKSSIPPKLREPRSPRALGTHTIGTHTVGKRWAWPSSACSVHFRAFPPTKCQILQRMRVASARKDRSLLRSLAAGGYIALDLLLTVS